MEKFLITATCLFGLEAVLSHELKHLGYSDQHVEDGRITFTGDFDAVCRTNIWLRTAERVMVKMGEFQAVSFEQLYENTKKLPWENWLPFDACFPVEAASLNSKLFSVPDCQAVIKEAVVESMKRKYHSVWFEESGARYKIDALILKDRVNIYIDTSGTGLYKRGYRKLPVIAPLKETLAAGLVLLSRWNRYKELIDPFCGSGTIPIEAALIGKNAAPGINRSFCSEEWKNISGDKWHKAREEARDLYQKNAGLNICGSDIDAEAVSQSIYNAKNAGVEKDIHFKHKPVSDIKALNKSGFIICNPPYGERIGDTEDIMLLYREMGSVFKRFDNWSWYILTAFKDFEKYFGKTADKKRKLYNGGIMCNYYQYFKFNKQSAQN